MRLSIVIPTLNEAAKLPSILPAAQAAAAEVWVSDGNSHDGTAELASTLGARIVSGSPGRGAQLNRGAAGATGDVLIFLHADTRLPDTAGSLVPQAVAQGAVGGGFRLRFDTSHPFMRFTSRCINLRTRITGCPLGDQAQFVRRDAFTSLGGYRDWPILEDLEFMRRLKRHGRTVVLAAPAVTSARRYLSRGIARTLAVNWLIFALYFAGVPPRRLARLYRPLKDPAAACRPFREEG